MTISADLVAAIVRELRMPRLDIYGGDWLRDPVSSCSLGAQGLWFRCMLIMHDAKPYGHLVGANGEPLSEKQLIRTIGCGASELSKFRTELESVGVPGRTGDNHYGEILKAELEGEDIDLSPLAITRSGIVYSRRMLRDQKVRVIKTLVNVYGNPKSLKHRSRRTGDVVYQPPHQPPHQPVHVHARARVDNDNDFDSVNGEKKETVDSASAEKAELTPQQKTVKDISEALELHTSGFLIPNAGRIVKIANMFTLEDVLATIAEEGQKGNLDGKNANYLQQCVESRKYRPDAGQQRSTSKQRGGPKLVTLAGTGGRKPE